MSRTRDVAVMTVALFAACILVAAGASAAAGTTATASNHSAPTLEASINGEPVADGDARIVRDGARLRLLASVPDANETVDTLLVTVDGETVYERERDGPVRLNRSLPLGGGNNTVRVLAEGTNEVAASLRFRVYLETVPPALRLREPVATDASPYFFPDLTVNTTSVTLAGEFSDVTGFAEATISHGRPGVTGTYESVRVQRPDTSFARSLLLYDGTNRIVFTTEDVLGNTYTGSFAIRVVDESAPELSLDYRTSTESRPRYTVSGTVRDNVWVSNATVSVQYYNNDQYQPRNRSYPVVPDRNYRRGASRLDVAFQQRIRLIEGENYVSVTAHDSHGNNVTRGYWVRYSPNTSRPPSIGLGWNRTVVRDDRTLVADALITDDDRDLDRVRVTVTNLDTDTATDVETIHPARDDTFLLDRPLTIAPGINRVTIRAFDRAGNSSQLIFFVDTATANVSETAPATVDQNTVTEAVGETATAAASGSGGDGGGQQATAGADTDGNAGSSLPVPPLPTLGGGVAVLAGVGYLWYRQKTRV